MPHPIIAIVKGKSWLRLVWKQPELIYGDVVRLPSELRGAANFSPGGMGVNAAPALTLTHQNHSHCDGGVISPTARENPTRSREDRHG